MSNEYPWQRLSSQLTSQYRINIAQKRSEANLVEKEAQEQSEKKVLAQVQAIMKPEKWGSLLGSKEPPIKTVVINIPKGGSSYSTSRDCSTLRSFKIDFHYPGFHSTYQGSHNKCRLHIYPESLQNDLQPFIFNSCIHDDD